MCLEDGQSQVEEFPKLISNKVRAQMNSEQNLEQNDSELHLEQSWTLQELMNYEV